LLHWRAGADHILAPVRRPVEIVYGWVKLHILYWLGVSPDRLAEIYKTHHDSRACS